MRAFATSVKKHRLKVLGCGWKCPPSHSGAWSRCIFCVLWNARWALGHTTWSRCVRLSERYARSGVSSAQRDQLHVLYTVETKLLFHAVRTEDGSYLYTNKFFIHTNHDGMVRSLYDVDSKVVQVVGSMSYGSNVEA